MANTLMESIAKLKKLSEADVEELEKVVVVPETPAETPVEAPVEEPKAPVAEDETEEDILKKIELANEELEKAMSDQEFPEEIKEGVRNIIKLKEEEIRQDLENEYADKQKAFEDEIVDKTDEYLNQVADQWLEDNKVAIKESVKVQNVQKFISGFKKLLEDTCIDLPDEAEQLINQYKEENDDLKAELSDKIEESFSKSKEIRGLKKALIVEQKINAMKIADSEKSKLRKLCEDVEFDGDEEKLEKDIDREFKDALEEDDTENEVKTVEEPVEDKKDEEVDKLQEAINRFRK